MANFKNNFLRLIDSGANQAKSFVEGFNDLIESFDMDAHMSYLNDRKKELIKKSNEMLSDFNDLLKQIKENLTDFSVTVPYDESIGEKIDYKVNGNKLDIEVSYSDETSTRSNRTSVAIPVNCDVEQISFSKNAILKTATIVIPKKFVEPKNDTEKNDDTTATKPTYYCPALGTLLTADEVKNGVTIKEGYPVVKLPTVEETVATDKPERKVIKKKKSATKKKQIVTEDEAETPVETPAETVEAQQPQETQEGETDAETEQHISSKLARRLQNNVSKYATALKRDSNGRFVRRVPNN